MPALQQILTAAKSRKGQWLDWKRRAKAALRRRRPILYAAAVCLFVAGCAWSINSLDLQWSDVEWNVLAIALFLVAPALLLNALELQLCAQAAGCTMPLSYALSSTSFGTIANLLPVPASALIRGGALVHHGASVSKSALMIFLVGMLWFAVAACLSLWALGNIPGHMSLAMLAGLCAAAVVIALTRTAGTGVMLQLVGVRILILGLAIARLTLCFRAIGGQETLSDAAVYTVAPVIGSGLGIAPAGIGISETIGASLALISKASAAQAFMALGLSRLLALILAGAIAAALQVRREPVPAQA